MIWNILRIVRDKSTAEDLAHDAYLRARSAIESGTVEHVEAFLNSTVRNLALDHVRKRKVREQFEQEFASDLGIPGMPTRVPDLENAVIARERMRQLDLALASLPERTRQVFILHRIEGLSYPEVAQYLGVSERTVFQDAKEALAHCRDQLDRLDRK